MVLELFESDLRPESQNKNTIDIRFVDLNEQAQGVVKLVGKATFYRNKGTPRENYRVIYPNR